jgi:hypothetical protein
MSIGQKLACVAFLAALGFIAFALSTNGTSSPYQPPTAQELVAAKAALPPEPTEAERIAKGCAVRRKLTADKKISDLTVKEIEQLEFCKALGY